MSDFTWTEEKTAEAVRLYITEGYSASRTAKAIGGVSRNAVIGKIHRLGFKRTLASKLRVHAGYPKREAKIARRGEPAGLRVSLITGLTFPKAATKPLPTAPSDIASPHAKPWIERQQFECAFIVEGEGADSISCCNGTLKDYCAGHAAIMFTCPQSLPTLGPWFDRMERPNRANKAVRPPRTFDEWAAA